LQAKAGTKVVYLRFNVADSGTVRQALLKLNVTNKGGPTEVSRASMNGWDELGITLERPARV
jgi:hypothetical protein